MYIFRVKKNCIAFLDLEKKISDWNFPAVIFTVTRSKTLVKTPSLTRFLLVSVSTLGPIRLPLSPRYGKVKKTRRFVTTVRHFKSMRNPSAKTLRYKTTKLKILTTYFRQEQECRLEALTQLLKSTNSIFYQVINIILTRSRSFLDGLVWAMLQVPHPCIGAFFHTHALNIRGESFFDRCH